MISGIQLVEGDAALFRAITMAVVAKFLQDRLNFPMEIRRATCLTRLR